MEILKTIIEKFKLKELCAISFFFAVIITFIPQKLAQLLKIDMFRDTYQTYVSLCMIVIGSYYLMQIFTYCGKLVIRIIINQKRIALKYMKEDMSMDEMQLLIEIFYDRNNRIFHTTGLIDLGDGRKAALENKYVLYQSSPISTFYTKFAYNLQPYALEFLNHNLKTGNIEIKRDAFTYDLKRTR